MLQEPNSIHRTSCAIVDPRTSDGRGPSAGQQDGEHLSDRLDRLDTVLSHTELIELLHPSEDSRSNFVRGVAARLHSSNDIRQPASKHHSSTGIDDEL